MLRLIPLPRQTRLPSFPLSTFAAASRSVRHSHSSQSRSHKKHKSKPPAPPSRWRGLSQRRMKILRLSSRRPSLSQPSLFNATFDTILISSLRHHPIHLVSPLISHAVSLAPNNYQPSDHVLVAILDATVSAASARRLRFSPPDIATETLFRLTHAFDTAPSIPLLQAVAKHAAADPVVERRSTRIWSVLREAASRRQTPTPQFVYLCFETCVAALDVPAAVTIMEHALSAAMYHDHLPPRVIDYYNAVMYAAILQRQLPVVDAVVGELRRKAISTDSRTEALLLAAYLDSSDPRAEQLRARVKPPLPDLVHAATIREAARQNNVPAILEGFHNFENDLRQAGRCLHDTLSQPAVANLPAFGALSESTMACARADPTMSAFRALRTCGAPEEAAAILVRLQERYGFKPSKLVYSTIIETAWKTGKLQLAQKLRVDMKSSAAVGYTTPEKRDIGAYSL